MESESYTITIQNSTHHNPNSISNDSDGDSTIDINQKRFRFQLSLESESAPGLNNFPVIIMLVCEIFFVLNYGKHVLCCLGLIYYIKLLLCQKHCLIIRVQKLLGNWNVLLIVLKYILKVLGMYLSTFPQKGMYLYLSTFPQKGMYLYLSTFLVESTCTCN